jgi:two-component system, NarL family, invasion response regulator UvrY
MIKILLADDHQMFREGIKQILSNNKDIMVCNEAGNGHEVIDRLTSSKYDILLLDISMPGINIFDLLNEIKKIDNKIPILILSMHPEEQYAFRLLKGGIAGYLTKESAADELILAIKKVYSGGKYISQKLAETIAYAIEDSNEKISHHQLSNREFEVMMMLASGKSLKEIAESLFISQKTVTTYRTRILEKLQLKNNAELTRYTIENQLLN